MEVYTSAMIMTFGIHTKGRWVGTPRATSLARNLAYVFPRGSSIYFYNTKKITHFLELIVHDTVGTYIGIFMKKGRKKTKKDPAFAISFSFLRLCKNNQISGSRACLFC